MVLKFCILIICLSGLKVCLSQRRIIHGTVSQQGKKFMVYLLNSRYSAVQPDAWLCGGALISDRRILTSAACLTEVQYIYVIAGYTKYVSGKDIDKDECTRTRKQKVVEIIVPKAFKEIGIVKPTMWMKVDAGVAVVEKPYVFTDLSYRSVCSYEPASISVNFDTKLEQPNTVAVVYGWGGTKARKPGEKGDINSEYLKEARTVITNTTFCANYVTEEMKSIVNESLICAFGTRHSSSSDKELISEESSGNGCKWRRFNLNESNIDDCNEDEGFLFRNRQRNKNIPRKSNYDARRDNSDKSDGGGICENDHGGPLISWIGVSEIIIGIALTSIYNVKYECEGPFLYIGTARSGSLIHCLLATTNETRELCQYLNNDVHSSKINWPKESNNSTNPRRQQLNIKQLSVQVQQTRLAPVVKTVQVSPEQSVAKVAPGRENEPSRANEHQEPAIKVVEIQMISHQWPQRDGQSEQNEDSRVALRPQIEIGKF